MKVEHHTIPHGHPLAPHVLYIFRMRGKGHFSAETILPKGNVDLLFNSADALHVTGCRLGAQVIGGPTVLLAGVQTRSFVSRPQGHVDLLGISLRAEGSAALVPIPLHELTDRAIEAPIVFPELSELAERLWELRSFREQCDLLVGWLLSRLRPAPNVHLVQHACMLLRQSKGEDAVRRAARATAVSPRHLRRLFAHHVGLSPADFARLRRFADALHLLGGPQPKLTHVAHEVGYYDQPHFCRDFRQFGGMTPIEYRRHAGPTVGHLFSA